MDRSLDEIIDDRPQRDGGRKPPTGPRMRDAAPRPSRREEYPRDGVRKYGRDERVNIDSDWVHDRFEDDRHDRNHRRSEPETDRYEPAGRVTDAAAGTKLRVDNVHYDLTEDELRGLFERKGPLVSVKLLYDRMDRSQGTAFVTYEDPRDARDALDAFDGQNANGQAIKITVLPTAPAAASRGASLFDRIERAPPRSLFDRIEGGARAGSREDTGRRRRERSDSPRKSRPAPPPAPDNIDRYVPRSRDSRSPPRRRGTPREPGRRPGARREDSGRGAGGGRRTRTDEEGRPLVGGRPRKTAEELDAEMADYWGGGGGKTDEGVKTNGAAQHGGSAGAAATAAEDTDMVL